MAPGVANKAGINVRKSSYLGKKYDRSSVPTGALRPALKPVPSNSGGINKPSAYCKSSKDSIKPDAAAEENVREREISSLRCVVDRLETQLEEAKQKEKALKCEVKELMVMHDVVVEDYEERLASLQETHELELKQRG